MKLPCDIVMDLITIYHDSLASEESIKAVEEHLKSCENCRRLYKDYNLAELKAEGDLPENPEDFIREEFSILAKRLRRRRYFYAGVSIIYIVLSIVISGYLWLKDLKDRSSQA